MRKIYLLLVLALLLAGCGKEPAAVQTTDGPAVTEAELQTQPETAETEDDFDVTLVGVDIT